MKFRELVRILATYDIQWDSGKGKGSHGAFVGLTLGTRIRRVFVIPRNQQKDVHQKYLNTLRRTFELTSENGAPGNLFK